MKKLLSLILCLILCLSLFACNSEAEKESTTKATTEVSQENKESTPLISWYSNQIFKVSVKDKNPGTTVFNKNYHYSKIREIYNYLNSFSLKETDDSSMVGETIVCSLESEPYEENKNNIQKIEIQLSENNKICVVRTSGMDNTYYDVLNEDYDPISFFEEMCNPQTEENPNYTEFSPHPSYDIVKKLQIEKIVLSRYGTNDNPNADSKYIYAEFIAPENSIMILQIFNVLNNLELQLKFEPPISVAGGSPMTIEVYYSDGTKDIYHDYVGKINVYYNNGKSGTYRYDGTANESLDPIRKYFFDFSEE